ncbi:hypothetical protein D3C77_127280 [compost metagenome]
MRAAAVLAPVHFLTATPQAQGHLELGGVVLQHAQVELHQVPADDCIGVMHGQPVVQALEQAGTAVAVFEIEIHALGVAVGRAEHVHLALAAAFEGDGIQLAALGGFDVE